MDARLRMTMLEPGDVRFNPTAAMYGGLDPALFETEDRPRKSKTAGSTAGLDRKRRADDDALPGGIMPLEVDVPVRPIFTSPLDAVRPAGVTEADSIAVALMAKPMVGPLPTRGVGGGSASGAGGAGGAGGSAAMDM
eukprot:c10528_g1_i2.p2 GENE.c10528_g1_i2~~c10528_g1_i2.p2  ORF type:complete len:137 (-),score=6.39 c10528_g1_i2:200-610(-)